MNSTTSKKLHFALSSREDLKRAITQLSGVFHVVPSATPDAEQPLLNVEIDDQFPELVTEVRRIVQATDSGSRELHETR